MQLAGPNVLGPPDDPESARQVLRLAAELGVTFFDTANAYGPRTVNQLIGEALRPFPGEVIVGNQVGAGRGDPRQQGRAPAAPGRVREHPRPPGPRPVLGSRGAGRPWRRDQRVDVP